MTNDEATRRGDGRTQCPCQEFIAMSKIVVLLNSREKVDCLIRWLKGETDNMALNEGKLLSCGKRSRCRFRYGTSFAILNAIRDACRPFLEQQPSSQTTTVVSKPSVSPSDPATYEDAFPALSNNKLTTIATSFSSNPHPAASNILVPRKKPKDKKVEPSVNRHQVGGKKNKPKRRIRPQPATAVVPNNPVWGQQQNVSATQVGIIRGNISNSSQDPVTRVQKSTLNQDPQDAFETRFGAGESDSRRLFTNELNSDLPTLESVSGTDGSTFSKSNSQHSPRILDDDSVSKFDVVKEAPEEHVHHLVEIYIALIRNMLIPSTPLEIHLLIRLLAIDVDACATAASKNRLSLPEEADSTPIFFQSIFSSPKRCRLFASLAISKLKSVIRNLGVPLMNLIIQCGPIRMACSKFIQDLTLVREEQIRRGLLTESTPEDVTGTHAILSLPFEQDRDSRHNYRTQAEMAIYKNREQSRDAFLYQLRSYMSVKGKGFQAQDMEKAKGRLQEESRNITSSLFAENMPWFAQFFCELLLQVGMSPVEETDQELLDIADKEKLQRLHKRFSSRSSHANKSSKKLVLSSNRPDSSSELSLHAAAQVNFSGYQEFFFIFLHSADNYNLGIHLRNRMVAAIASLSSNHSTSNLERRLMDLQLFARFLGYLVFSPNWHGNEIELEKLNHDPKVVATSNGLRQLESLGLPLTKMVEESWTKGYSVLVIPWVTEILKMSKWDSISLSSLKFRQLLSHLRTFQFQVINLELHENERFGPSMQILSFYLESFFHKTVGLPKLTSLPKSTLPLKTNLPAESLDLAAVGFSMATMFSASSNIEDISTLINGLSMSLPVGKSSSKARKLRPSVVSRGLISLEADSLRESPLKRYSPTSNADYWQSPDSLFGNDENYDNIQRKLDDEFFHQHRDLKVIAEFAVNQVIKNTTGQVLNGYVKDAFEEQNVGVDPSDQNIETAQGRALELSNKFLRKKLHSSIRATVSALGPASLQPKVLDVAVSLSVARGLQSGQALLQALVLKESNAFLESMRREEKKKISAKALTFSEEQQGAGDVVFSLQALQSYLGENSCAAWSVQEVLCRIQAALDHTKDFASSSLQSMPPESELRKMFAVLFDLDSDSVHFIEWGTSLNDNDCFSVLSAFFRLVTRLAEFTSYGVRQISKCIDNKVLIRLIMARPDTLEAAEETALLLKGMVLARLVNRSMLKLSFDDESDSRISGVKHLVEANLQ